MGDRDKLQLRRAQTGVQLALVRGLRAMERRVGELLVREGIEDLTPAQGSALLILFEARAPITGAQLAEALSVSQVTAGRFVRALEGNGWITRERSPTDARAMLIRLTERARRQLPALIRVSNAVLDEAFTGFDQGEISTFVGLAERLASGLRDP